MTGSDPQRADQARERGSENKPSVSGWGPQLDPATPPAQALAEFAIMLAALVEMGAAMACLEGADALQDGTRSRWFLTHAKRYAWATRRLLDDHDGELAGLGRTPISFGGQWFPSAIDAAVSLTTQVEVRLFPSLLNLDEVTTTPESRGDALALLSTMDWGNLRCQIIQETRVLKALSSRSSRSRRRRGKESVESRAIGYWIANKQEIKTIQDLANALGVNRVQLSPKRAPNLRKMMDEWNAILRREREERTPRRCDGLPGRSDRRDTTRRGRRSPVGE